MIENYLKDNTRNITQKLPESIDKRSPENIKQETIEQKTIEETKHLPYQIYACRKNQDRVFILVSDPKQEIPNSLLIELNPKSNSKKILYEFFKERVKLFHPDYERGLAVVVYDSLQDFCIFDLDRGLILKRFRHKQHITSVGLHPTKNIVALGDAMGKITFMHILDKSLDEDEKTVVKQTMHWHAHSVGAIEFTSDGVYMISGGNEATLVIWQLDSGHKQFLPRLGATIKSITVSPDEMTYTLEMANNSLVYVGADDLVAKRGPSGLHAAQLSLEMYPMTIGLQVEPKTDNVFLNGSASSLQSVSSITGQTMQELDFLESRNRVTYGEKVIKQPHVRHAKFSVCGTWLVTVDDRPSEFSRALNESTLKFWKCNQDGGFSSVHTRVDNPHKDVITGVAIYGDEEDFVVVTTSKDKSFKIWECTSQGNSCIL